MTLSGELQVVVVTDAEKSGRPCMNKSKGAALDGGVDDGKRTLIEAGTHTLPGALPHPLIP